MNIITKISFLLITLLFTNAFASEFGGVTGLPIPRFVSLKSSETNLRKGPNYKFPVNWIYKQKGYPMQLIAEFENWRKLRDEDGSEGWVHENLISGIRHLYIARNNYKIKNEFYSAQKSELILFKYPDETSYPIARMQIGTLGKLKNCQKEWCKIKIANFSGWVLKQNTWGVLNDEIIK